MSSIDPSSSTTPPVNPVTPHIGDPESEGEHEPDDDNGDDLILDEGDDSDDLEEDTLGDSADKNVEISSPPPEVEAIHPSSGAIVLAFAALKQRVPPEIAREILVFAKYYSVQSTQLPAARRLHDNRVPILASPALTPRQRRQVVGVSLVIRSHDQGWSSYPENRGSRDNSWTWFSLEECDGTDLAKRLATNLHAVSTTQRYAFDWYAGDEVVARIRNGETIDLWACARFPGWANHVEYVKWAVYLLPI